MYVLVIPVLPSSKRQKHELHNIFVAEISLTDKKYFLAAETQDNMKEWVVALHDAAVSRLTMRKI